MKIKIPLSDGYNMILEKNDATFLELVNQAEKILKQKNVLAYKLIVQSEMNTSIKTKENNEY